MLEDIKVGDKVWIGYWRYNKDGRIPSRHGLRTVSRLTPTQLSIGENGIRYHRNTGKVVGHSSAFDVLSIATPEEIAEWEVRVEANRLAEEERKQREAIRTNIRLRLYNLFPDGSVYIEESGDAWDVTIKGLQEDQIRELAAAMTE